MNKPLVTVIMQNYNTSKDILDNAIYSVVNQSFKNFAFVFIDDWSTDYDIDEVFDKWLKSWKELRPDMPIHFIKKPQSGPLDPRTSNHGHSFCRNWGLDLVKSAKISDYVFFMDSDDEIMPNCLEILWSKIEKDPEVEISIGNFVRDEVRWCQLKDTYYNAEVNEGDTYVPGPHDDKIYTNLEALHVLCDPYMIPSHRPTMPSVAFCATWNKIFKVNLFDNVRFPDYRTKDDNFTAHRLLWNAKKIAFTFEITYFYRPGGKLADANLYKTMDIVDAHRDRVEFFEKIFEDWIRAGKMIREDNLEDYTRICDILRDEHMLYLFTLMAVYKNFKNHHDESTTCYEEFVYSLNVWKKEFVYGEQKFLEACVKWMEKTHMDRISEVPVEG